MHCWPGERPFLLKLRRTCFPTSSVLALGLSLIVHAGLIVAIFFGGIAQPGHAVLSDSEHVSMQVVMVKVGKAEEDIPATDVYEKTRKQLNMVGMSHDTANIPGGVGKDGSLLPALLPASPYYFSAKDLTQRPLVVRDVLSDMMLTVPDVPSQAATLQILINEYGEIDQVIVEDSLLPEAAQKVVVEAVVKTRFHPGEINGVPVKSQLRIEILLEDTVEKN